jgi:fatty acid CoA ligase FadD36
VLLRALAGPDIADAVRVGDEVMSTAELLDAATALGQRLSGAHALALHADPSMRTVVAVVAGLLAGVPVVPVPPDAGTTERDHILRDSGADIGIGFDGLLAGVPIEPTVTGSGRLPEPATDATALILYTSGTTGPPKGVLMPHAAIAADLDGLAEAWAWTPEDTLVHGLPLFHVHGLVLGLLGALRVGSRLVHTIRPRPELYAAAGGTLYFGVPTVWSRVVAAPECARALRSARLIVSGSAALPLSVFDGLTELTGSAPVERYGMTESLITLSTRFDGDRDPGSVGLPVSGIQTRLVAETGAVPSDGESLGDLQVRGPTLFDGYLGRPKETAASFTADGWFRTGDVATIDADGRHRIVGRASVDLIKSGGFRIGAGEVEDALLAHPAVREAAVVGMPHADLGQEVVAYVVAEDVGAGPLIDFVAGRLSAHKRPRRIHFLDALPRNAMGKLRKTELTARGE